MASFHAPWAWTPWPPLPLMTTQQPRPRLHAVAVLVHASWRTRHAQGPLQQTASSMQCQVWVW